ncbi:MAG: ArsA-related P-loop ATPase [Bdellovibrionota bacterium]
MSANSSAIEGLIHSNRVIVCCGSGGVGKTTTSAALAIRAAQMGKRSVVITIDPAKRLATSLGLQGLSSTPTDLTQNLGETVKGKFYAVMPNSEQTFEHFVRSMAKDQQNLAARVLKTSIYKIFTREFAGAHEYMAMEKLYELAQDQTFDLIVLDTPPSANTRVFLDAPNMLADFFDDQIMRWFVNPGAKILATGIKKLLEILERLTGRGFIAELFEFATALFELRTQFKENLEKVGQLLHQSDVAFLMVTSPERLSKVDTQDFVRLIGDRGYHFWGFVVNRVLSKRLGLSLESAVQTPSPSARIEQILATQKNPVASPEELKVLKESFAQLHATLQHELDAALFLRQISRRESNVLMIEEQPSDVHSVPALLRLCEQF